MPVVAVTDVAVRMSRIVQVRGRILSSVSGIEEESLGMIFKKFLGRIFRLISYK
jgi:hypothetical protein